MNDYSSQKARALGLLTSGTLGREIGPDELQLIQGTDAFGSFGVVQAAWLDSGTPNATRVAVKTLRPKYGLTPDRATIRAVREIVITNKADHRNVHRLLGYSVYDTGSVLSIGLVSEWCAEGTLLDAIKAAPAPPRSQRFTWIVQFTAGLEHLHSRGICHQDFKTDNIMILDGRAVVNDFGMAKELGTGPSGLTTSSATLGAFAFLAPELILASGKVERTLLSDVWAWACVAFHVIEMKPPFYDVENLASIPVHIYQGLRFPAPREALHPLADLGSLLQRCWEKEPSNRPPIAYCGDKLREMEQTNPD